MAIEVMVPRLGWSMESGVFGEWLKNDGDRVSPGDAIFSIEADKAIEEVESEDEGILRIIPGVAEVGAELSVGTVIGWIVEEGEPTPAGGGKPPAGPKVEPQPAATGSQVGLPQGHDARLIRPTEADDASPGANESAAVAAGKTGNTGVRLASSPRARRVARELGLDWQRAHGSGKTGRIVERDIRELAAMREATEARAPGTTGQATLTHLRVDADASELVALLDRLAQAQDGIERSCLYRAMLARLSVAAYRTADRTAPPAAAPEVLLGFAGERGFSFVRLSTAAFASGTDIAAEIQDLDAAAFAWQSDQTLRLRDDCLAIVDLDVLGVDEYAPPTAPPCPLLSFGRVRGRSQAGNPSDRPDTVRITLLFQPPDLELVAAAALLKRVSAAIEQPLPFLAL